MLSRGSAVTTDRLILSPDDSGHFFQIISSNDELQFQRFVQPGKPDVDSLNRFIGGRDDSANVETFMSLSNPYTNASSSAPAPPASIRIGKPVLALDDFTVQGILRAPGGISLGSGASIDSAGCIHSSNIVQIDGEVKASTLRVLDGILTVGNAVLSEDLANTALKISSSSVRVAGSHVYIGPAAAIQATSSDVRVLLKNNRRAVFTEASGLSTSATFACGNISVGLGGGEAKFGHTASGNSVLGFYKANVSLVSLEASTRGLTINVSGQPGSSTTSFYSSFTGTHVCIGEAATYSAMPGMIVEATGTYNNIGGAPLGPTDSVPIVRIASEGSKAVLGVIGYVEPPGESGTRMLVSGSLCISGNRTDRRIAVCSLGEGAMWVVAEGGSIETGDYIETSSIPGVGRKSASSVMTNRIVAKSSGPCAFANDTEVVMQQMQADGQLIFDQEGVPIMTPVLDSNSVPVTRPKYVTMTLPGTEENAYYIGVTFHCG